MDADKSKRTDAVVVFRCNPATIVQHLDSLKTTVAKANLCGR